MTCPCRCRRRGLDADRGKGRQAPQKHRCVAYWAPGRIQI